MSRLGSLVAAVAFVALGTVGWGQSPPASNPSGPSAPATASRQAANPSSPGTTIRVPVRVVNVPVTVLDKRGVPVIDMVKTEFEVFEDGRQQPISYFGKEPPLPLRIGLVVDTSNSARRQLQFEKDAASEFVFDMLRGRSSKNQIFLQTYDETSSVVQDFTNDPEELNDKISSLKAGGGKALYDAIYFACREKMLKAGPITNTRRVLILLSDGLDVQSKHSFDEAVSMAHLAQTMVYAIGNSAYGYSNPGDKVLRQLTEVTGGAAFFPQEKSPGADLGTGYLSHGQIGDTSQNKGLGAETGIYSAQKLMQLADSLDAIGHELNEQYTIGYTRLNDKDDGTYRSIRVVALRKGVQVRNKPGYFALAQP